MIADNYHKIGKTHVFCEDYSEADIYTNSAFKSGAYAIISDGCSGAEQTDIGARLLVKSRINILHSISTLDEVKRSAYKAEEVANLLTLKRDCLFATLLTVIDNGGESLKVEISGDGAVIARKRTGEVHISLYNYNGAPFYLNYILRDSIKFWAEAHSQKGSCEVKEIILKDNKISFMHTKEIAFNSIEQKGFIEVLYPKEIFDLVIVTSDGIESFYKDNSVSHPSIRGIMPERTMIPPEEIIPKLIDFKTYKGEFIRRRCNKFFQECEKENIHHYDDFSMAGIYLF